MRIRVFAAAACFAAVTVSAANAQSCATADATLGATKKNDKLKASYDKFADTTSLETGGQVYRIKDSPVYVEASFVAKHAGTAPSPMVAQLHLIGAYWWDHGVPVQIPTVFSDSGTVSVIADTNRFNLSSPHHTAPRTKTLVTSWEDTWFPVTPAQLAMIARARTGGMRLVDKGVTYDMELKGNLTDAAAAAYRTTVCSPSYAATP